MIMEETLPISKPPQNRALELGLVDGTWWSIYEVIQYKFYYRANDD